MLLEPLLPRHVARVLAWPCAGERFLGNREWILWINGWFTHFLDTFIEDVMLIFDVKIAYDAKTFQLRSQWEQAGHASAPVHLDQSQDKTHFLTNRRAAIIENDGLWVLTFGSWGHLLTHGFHPNTRSLLKHFLPPWISDPSLHYWLLHWAWIQQVWAVDDKLSVLSRPAAAGASSCLLMIQ